MTQILSIFFCILYHGSWILEVGPLKKGTFYAASLNYILVFIDQWIPRTPTKSIMYTIHGLSLFFLENKQLKGKFGLLWCLRN